LSVAEVQSLLRKDEALIVFLTERPVDNGLGWVWAITSKDSRGTRPGFRRVRVHG